MQNIQPRPGKRRLIALSFSLFEKRIKQLIKYKKYSCQISHRILIQGGYVGAAFSSFLALLVRTIGTRGEGGEGGGMGRRSTKFAPKRGKEGGGEEGK